MHEFSWVERPQAGKLMLRWFGWVPLMILATGKWGMVRNMLWSRPYLKSSLPNWSTLIAKFDDKLEFYVQLHLIITLKGNIWRGQCWEVSIGEATSTQWTGHIEALIVRVTAQRWQQSWKRHHIYPSVFSFTRAFRIPFWQSFAVRKCGDQQRWQYGL